MLLCWVFLPKYLKYGIITISEFIEMRYDVFTKRLVSLLFIFTYIVSFLPVVLYSESLVFNQLFKVSESLNVSDNTAVIIIAAVIGAVGILYLFIGGLSLSAYSDTLYGISLIFGGLLVTVLAFKYLGDESYLHGFDHIVKETPKKLNGWGAVDSTIVPWPTLMFGMFFNNLFFWCTNQMIVQKALAAKILKEAQKGAIYLSIFKIFSALFLLLPGIIVFNIFHGDVWSTADNAYPMLINTLLPEWALGIFGAIIFRVILSSFVGALNSTVTLFSLDFYKSFINKKVSGRRLAVVGRITTIIVGVIVVILAPVISLFPSGLYAVVQQFNGIYSLPVLILVVVGFFAKKTSKLGAKVTFITHIVLYTSTNLLLRDVHYLYILSVLFFIDLAELLIFNKLYPSNEFDLSKDFSKVDMTHWKYRYVAGIAVLAVVVVSYIIFSPLGVAT